jgi:cyclin B
LKFNLKPEVLYLTVALIDHYLERRQVIRQHLQLVGVTALLLASKYEEIYPPEIRDLVYVTDRAYTKEQILEMESRILNTLSFRLSFPTIFPFLNRYLKAAGANSTVRLSAYYYAEKALVDFAMVQYLPSTVAAACVTLALQNHGEASWTPTLEHYSELEEGDFAPASIALSSIVRRAARSSLQAVRKKYTSEKLGRVAEKVVLTK